MAATLTRLTHKIRYNFS